MSHMVKKLSFALLTAALIFSLSLIFTPAQTSAASTNTTITLASTSKKSSSKSKGQKLVNYAKKFLGNPYRYGGSSLTHGTDCSGFVMALYRHYGYKLPHSSYALRSVGKRVKGGIKNARPGDIICYYGHVAIYMGGNRVIHASNPSSGIKITNNASYRRIAAIRRIF